MTETNPTGKITEDNEDTNFDKKLFAGLGVAIEGAAGIAATAMGAPMVGVPLISAAISGGVNLH